MEIFQLQTKSWFLPRQLFLQDPTLSTIQDPIFCHILSGAMAQEHRTSINLMNYQNNLQTYKWRFKQNQRIVPIYNIEMLEAVRTEATVSILCEKIFFQMQEIFDKLTISEQIYIFTQVLEALKELSQKLRHAHLTPKMIGLNKSGKCRVWINENHASNDVQHPCESQEEQFQALFDLFYNITNVNAIFAIFMEGMTQLPKKYQTIKQYTQHFKKEKIVSEVNGVNISNLVKMIEKEGSNKWSELDCPPSFTFKRGKQSTEVTFSQKQSTFRSKDSVLHSKISPVYNFSEGPKFSLNCPKRNHKKLKTFNLSSGNKRVLSHLQNKICSEKIQQSQASPINSLGLCSRLEESIVIDSDINYPKGPSFDINELEKLGRIGKFCESMIAEELILEEFKDIYG